MKLWDIKTINWVKYIYWTCWLRKLSKYAYRSKVLDKLNKKELVI